jgi:DNA-binding NarL/FixJ family response regulator
LRYGERRKRMTRAGLVHPHSAVILDPHPLWIEAVSGVLKGIGAEIVWTATDTTSALRMIEELQPELFVLEPTIEDGIGLVCLRRALELRPELRTIVVSSREERTYIEEVLASGASAFVTKSAHPDDLASAVRQAFRHSIYFRAADSELEAVSVADAEAVSFEPADAEPEPASALDYTAALLTRRELEILALVARGTPNAGIAKGLWVSEQTVKFHLSNIYRKLEVSNRTEASRWAHMHGVVAAEHVEAKPA